MRARYQVHVWLSAGTGCTPEPVPQVLTDVTRVVVVRRRGRFRARGRSPGDLYVQRPRREDGELFLCRTWDSFLMFNDPMDRIGRR